jgi:hypothetical protein
MDKAENDKRRAQEEALREIAANRRQEIENRRAFCTGLRFWQFCRDRRCKRARQCAGDAEACFRHFWPIVPDNLKNKIRQAIVFMSEGMAPHEAAAAAIDHVGQRQRIDDAMAARERGM